MSSVTLSHAGPAPDTPLSILEPRAEEAAALLASMANAKRLLVLCHLVERERSVGELAAFAGLSQSALSQHLAKMRLQGLVATRREGQTIHYRLASREVRAVLETLYGLFCAPAEG
ncbi:ArsR/SmtB family transcription factor [Azorhizobium doebereinerae]|uniref:ArsR/SmtB family transcription factor n=1 Tax=Azorhizobium doebereinerae TaxID=281091 RepID=UPI000419C070|nr:metalloregulator ArsR/SmtB family transcription factor [Azorhizobium doebereinerae]